jgi:hypothetical protein
VKKRFKVDWSEVARPDGCGGLTLEEQLATYQWLCRSARGYTEHVRWGSATPYAILSAGSALFTTPEPIRALSDVTKRLQWAVLARPRSKSDVSWREDNGIRFDGWKWIPGPVDDVEEGWTVCRAL